MFKCILAMAITMTCTAACVQSSQRNGSNPVSPDARFEVGKLLYADEFDQGIQWWCVEMERAGHVRLANHAMEIDVPAGCTVWFRPRLDGPLMIEYEATVISAGAKNDRVSDLNSFWMAR